MRTGIASSALSTPRDLSTLPRPSGRLPLLGHLLELEPARLHLQLEGWAARLGESFVVEVAGKRLLILSDLELIQKILRDRPSGFRRLSALRDVLDELGVTGVFSAEGAEWSRQRKLIMGAFSPGNLRSCHAPIAVVTRRLQALWARAAARGEPVDALRDLMRYTVDVTSVVAFGDDMNTLEQGTAALQQHLQQIFVMVSRRINAPFPHWRYVSLPRDRALHRALAEVERVILAIIQRARAELERDPHRAPRNLLEAMIAARDDDDPGARLSDRELYGNVLTLLLAGEDTTANTIAWMLYFMAKDRDVQRRMAAEAEAHLDPSGVPASPEAARELHVIAAVAQETLRLKSAAPLLFLESLRDAVIGDIAVPAGTPVIALTRALALKAGAFHDPRTFDPGRWLGASGNHEPRAALAFGGGPRVCPGRSLALLECSMVGAMVARSFDVSLAEGGFDVQEHLDFTMRPANLRIRFSPRAEHTK